jgi:Ser/Thr protein kinase RdoA (MazF antagonist)
MTIELQTKSTSQSSLWTIADQFKPQGNVVSIREYGNGNINNTFLVTLDTPEQNHFILQRINTTVFRQPELVMRNMRTFTQHVQDRLQQSSSTCDRRWEVPHVLLTQAGHDYWIDDEGLFWRAIGFIGAAETFDTVKDSTHAQEIGYALGMFHHLVSDLPADLLVDTLEGFHITPRYLQQYEDVLATVTPSPIPEVQHCLQFIAERRDWAHVLENAKTQGKLCLRPMHGDPKINNIMIDTCSGQAISIVDLDTVKPGLIHYDIGDCLRSGCNLLGEETEQWEAVCFDPDLCQSMLQGYLSVASNFLTAYDYEYLYDAIRLIAFELGLRFFTDYLAGNVYFKTRYPDHNLARALVQFKLTESIEAQESVLRAIIQRLRTHEQSAI